MTSAIVVPEQQDLADREIILQGLIGFNEQAIGPSDYGPLAVLVTDPETGAPIGGVWGRAFYGWLFVELFFVPEHLRGQGVGARLLAAAEAQARVRGCSHVWLDTYAFQAPGFYRKHGYEVFGTLEDYPQGSQRLFFRKSL